MALAPTVLISLSVATTLLSLCSGFSPNYLQSFSVFSPDSRDHQEITNGGALITLRNYLLDNPNSDLDSTSAIESLQDSISARSLFGAYYQGTANCTSTECDLIHRYYTQALESIQLADTSVDSTELGIPVAHFDNDEIPEGNNRIQVKRQLIISNIQRGDYDTARLETGQALHTIQDFYSHSNWVELENTEPLEELGRLSYTPSNVASQTVPTCNSCERGQDAPAQLLTFTANLVRFRHAYDCIDNLRSDIKTNNVLTTGFTGSSPTAEKPDGKCSHGGLLDSTSLLDPEGGINKDFKSIFWSPRFDLHDQAADLAVRATALFLQDIREEVGDQAFGEFLNIGRARSSVAFVIDTSGSTVHLTPILSTLPNIQEGLESFQESTGGAVDIDYILVPLSNPDEGMVQVTDNFTELRDSIQELTGTGMGPEDCMEPSIGAIIRAASYSTVGGVINIFTDSQPTDIQRVAEALSIIKAKNLKLNVFFITGCVTETRRKRLTQSELYQQLAFLSGGQILDVPVTDLANIGVIVSTSISPAVATIVQKMGTQFSGMLPFQVDSTVTKVYITIDGEALQVGRLLSPQGEDISAQSILRVILSSGSTYLAVLSTPNDIYYGTWNLVFNSSTPYRVFITVDSGLSYMYTLYRGQGPVNGKVQSGEPLFPEIIVNREVDGATLTAGSLVALTGDTLLPFSFTGDGMTSSYVGIAGGPPVPFALSVTGEDSRGFPLTRIIGDGVDVSDITVGLNIGQSPFQVLRSGDSRLLRLAISNSGAASTFTVQMLASDSSSGFTYSFEGSTNTSQTVSIDSQGATSLSIRITAQENIGETNSLSLTVVIYDQALFTRNNYFNIRVDGTSVPPVDISQIDFYNAGKKPEGGTFSSLALLSTLIIIGAYLY